VETLMTLRIEKGFLHVGSDTDGMTLPQDIGFSEIMNKKPDDFVGRRSAHCPEGKRADRRQLVGLEIEGGTALKVGAHIVGNDYSRPPYRSQGWVTSSIFSPTLHRPVAMAMVQSGRERMGQQVRVFDGGTLITATIINPTVYDPSGERIHG